MACKIAMSSEGTLGVAEPAIEATFHQFFDMDTLTQVAVMDFVALLGKCSWTSSILSRQNFLPQLFERFSYG